MKCAKRLDLVFCMVLLYITTAESFKCIECKTGDCKEDKEVECVAATAAPPAGGGEGGEGGGDEAAAEAAEGEGKRFIQRQKEKEKEKWQCFTLVGKAKEGDKELTIKGCTMDGKCTSDLLKADGQKCTPCDKENCNSGEHLKPTTLSFIFFTVMTCLVISHH